MKISICRAFLVMTAVFVCAVFFSYSSICYGEETDQITYTMEDGTELTCTLLYPKLVRLDCVTLGPGVTDLQLPEEMDGRKIQEIARTAFTDCRDDLKTLYIPASVTSIDTWYMDVCGSLESIQVADDNPEYFSRDGVLFRHMCKGNTFQYHYDNSALVYYPPNRPGSYYLLPLEVVRIERLNSNCLEVLEILNPNVSDPNFSIETVPNLKTLIVTCGKSVPWYCCEEIVIGDGKIPDCRNANATIISTAGSEAEAWAKERGYSFQALPETTRDKRSKYGWCYLDHPSYNIVKGAKLPSNVPWEFYCSKEDCVEIEDNGNVTVKKSGIFLLAAYVKYDGEHLPDCRLITFSAHKIQDYLTEPSIYVKAGTKTVQLEPITGYPGMHLIYRSEDESALTVDQNGKVTLLTSKPGFYNIRVENTEETDFLSAGYCFAQIHIEANPIPQTVRVKSHLSAIFGKNKQIYATAKTSLSYKSLSPGTAKVSKKGVVRFLHPGTATILVSAAKTEEYKPATKKVQIKCKIKKPKLKVKKLSSRSAKVSWSKVPGADKYMLYVKLPGEKKYHLAAKRTANVKSVKHKNLKKGKKYSYKVRAYVRYKDKTYFGPYSKAVTIKVK